MAKNNVKQLNYTVEEINEAIDVALGVGLEYSEDKNSVQLVTGTDDSKKVLGSIQNPGAEIGGLTLKYIDDKTLRIYNTNGSKDENDWTPVGNEVVIISADQNVVAYHFDFTPVSATEPQVFVKESVDADIQNSKWQIQYQIKQLDNKGNISYDPIEVVWKVTSGNNSREFKETIKYGVDTLDAIYSFNWVDKIYKDSNFYKAGSYNVSATFYGVDGLKITRRWDFSLTSLTFKTTFDETLVYKDNIITIPFEVNGNMQKTVKGYIINKQLETETLLGSIDFVAHTLAQAGEFTVSGLIHGTYAIRLECTGVSGKTKVSAPFIYKEFIFVEDGKSEPLIRWSYPESTSLQQYARTAFQYGVYSPENSLTDIAIELYSENNKTTQTRTVTPNNTTYTWYYYPTIDSSKNGQLTPQEFTIRTIDLEQNILSTKNIVVNPFDGADKIVPIDGAQFDFNPLGRTNYDLNRDEYLYKGKNILTVSENFDWANGGWVQENIGTNEKPQIVDAFLIKAGSSVTLDYELFASDIKNTGKNMKFIFKTTNCQRMTAPVMVCKGENNTGLIINSQNAEIYYRADSEQAVIDIPYVEEEIIELEYNIESETHGRKPLLVTYLAGDPSQAVTCETTSEGELGQWTQDIPEKLVFGSDYCDIYLYRVKVYGKELNDTEIMQNYYADAFDGTTAYQRYLDNDILEDGQININKLKDSYPELRILMIDCKDVWSNGKKDFREVYVEHHYPNGGLKDNWKANAAVAIQGTSSVEYLTSAGNFDIDLSFATMGNTSKEEYITPTRPIGLKYLFDGSYYSKEELAANPQVDAAEVEKLLETSYAMTDESLPIDYINVKVNVASSENANNARLANWFNKYNAYKRRARQYNDKIRDTMEFHPCVVFIRENAGLDNREFDNDGNYHFYACGDFGNSKKNNNVFGMGEEAKYIVNELITNGTINDSDKEAKIAEFQAKECIVEVSNNINDICRFKTALFENYQTSYDEKKGKVVEADVWDGDAVEFRYKSDKKLAKAETLKLWKWVYSVDAANPGRNEILISNIEKTEYENNVIYSFDTPIPYTDDFSIIDIAPNFLFNKTSVDAAGKETNQTFSKYSVSKFVKNILGKEESDHIQTTPNLDGKYRVSIIIPKENLIYADFKDWQPKFFISFDSKYVLNWTSDSTFEITTTEDTQEYRNNKFKEEYENYFEKDSVLYFYLFTERFTMIDNRAKNTFIHFDGLKWNYCFDYDNDTALGCNNRGYLTMDYGVEDIDNADGYPLSTHGGNPAFNANDSVIWVNIRNNLYGELQQAYNRSSLAWSSASMNNDFETYQGYKCNWLQMIDMRRKYLRPYTDGHGPSTKAKVYEEKYLPMLQGRKTLQRRRYQKYQEVYFESKYTQTTAHNQFTFRAAFSNIGPQIVPYIKCYPIIDWDDADPYTKRTWPGETYATPMREIENDLNFTIYPAQHISAVNGLNNAGVKSASMGNGIKLTDINLSDNPELPSGENAKLELSGNQTLLTNLNLKRTGATIVPSLSELTNIQYLNTEDTKVSAIIFANGGLIREAKLGALTKNLSCVNNSNLETLTIQKNENGKYNLEVITINNPSKLLNWVEVLELDKCPNLKEITILNVNYEENDCWSFEDNSWIEKLYKLDKATLSGNIYIDKVREPDYDKYLDRWPGLTIQHAETFLPTYIVKYYNNADCTEYLFEEVYDEDQATTKPVITPTKEENEKFKYEFLYWSKEKSTDEFVFGTALNTTTKLYAVYKEIPQQYTVNWYYKAGGALLCSKQCGYGTEAVYEPAEGAIDIFKPQQDEIVRSSYNLFKGWNKSTGFIKGNLDVIALWDKGNATVYPQDGSQWSAAQLYTIAKQNRLKEFFAAHNPDGSLKTDENGKALPNGDRIAITMGRNFEYENIEKIKLIEEPKICKGVKEDYQEFDVQLAYDEDWTLLIDAQFIYSASGTVLVSYGRGDSGYGFNLVRSGTGSYAYPYIQWGAMGASTKTTRSRLGDGREVFVLRYEKDTKTIKVFEGCGSEAEPKTWKFTSSGVGSNLKLALGGWKTTDGYARLASGIVHRCEIWKGLLGENECKELVSWPRETIEFEIAGFDGYNTADGQTKMDLFAAQSLWERYNLNTNFHDSSLKTWLNTRFLKALPYDWQAILNNPLIGARHSGTEVEVKETKIWTPATIEMFKYSGYTYGEDFTIGYNRPPYSSNESGNRRLTPGVATVEIYSYSADWIKKQASDPSLDEELVNGSIWAGSTYKIYYYGFWLNWGAEYLTRTITSDKGYVVYTASGGSYTQTSSSITQHVVPCLSI